MPSHENTQQDVLIVGAGGHGAVVLDILREMGTYRPAGFIDADPSLVGNLVGGVQVLGPLNLLPRLRPQIRLAIVAIGDNRIRRSYATKLLQAGFELVGAIHPSANVSKTAKVGRNTVIAAGVIVSTSAKIGDSVLLNTGCLIDHECEVGDGVHIGPGARLAGRVQVAAGAFVGLGASVIQCLHIGEEAIVGAGAVVVRDVEAGTTVIGVPARALLRSPIAA